MELTLVRHGQPDWNPGDRVSNDPDLTQLGQAQAEALAARPWPAVDELWVSPMLRARRTATPLAEALGVDPLIRDWLAEINPPPVWEGSPIDELAELIATMHLRSITEMWDGLPGGESFRDFHRRVTAGLEGALAEIGTRRLEDGFPHLWEPPPPRRTMIVAHGGTNAVILGHLLGLDPTPWEWDRFDSAHASCATVTTREIAHGAAFGMTRFGDVGHLRPEMVTW